MALFLAPLFLWTAFAPPENALRDFAVLQRTGVTATLDVVIAISGATPIRWWDKTHKLGIFLQERAHPERLTTLSADSGPLECRLRIERVTASETVIACEVEKGLRSENWKYTYNVRTKRLTGQITYHPFAMYRAYSTAGEVVFVGGDSEHSVAVEFNRDRTPTLRVLSDTESKPWLNHVSAAGLNPPQQRRPPIPPLPRTTFDQFAQARPERVESGYSRKVAQIADSVGPWEQEGQLVWFAKNFPDEEGQTGVGGFGYFDLETRKFHMIPTQEIVNWSVSAMSVAPDAVWLALVENGEYGSTGGGLLRYDRQSGAVQRFRSKDITIQLVRQGDMVLAATSEGIMVMEAGHARRYFLDRTRERKLKISRADI